jgi:hypothetical protein
MEHFALKIIRERSRRAGSEKARDLPIGVSLSRFHEGVEDAPENARPLGERFALPRWAADEGAEIPAMCRVAHDHLAMLELFSALS